MARRKREKPIAVDRAFWRGNQLNTRLRAALWAVEPSLAAAITEDRLQANDLADPHRRLRELAALADRVRPHVPPGVVHHTLPESLTARGSAEGTLTDSSKGSDD